MSIEAASDRKQDVDSAPGGIDGGLSGGEEPLADLWRRLPRDVGWLLVLGGLIGFVAPGIFGLDRMALGGLIVWPGNQRRVERWLEDDRPTPRCLRGTIKPVNRLLDDLARRYLRGKRPWLAK